VRQDADRRVRRSEERPGEQGRLQAHHPGDDEEAGPDERREDERESPPAPEKDTEHDHRRDHGIILSLSCSQECPME
jgi:hypothetical protein